MDFIFSAYSKPSCKMSEYFETKKIVTEISNFLISSTYDCLVRLGSPTDGYYVYILKNGIFYSGVWNNKVSTDNLIGLVTHSLWLNNDVYVCFKEETELNVFLLNFGNFFQRMV